MSESELLKGLYAEPGIHNREWQVVNSTGHRICYVQAFSEDEAIYLAHSIVRALNSHEELLAALKALVESDDGTAPWLHEAWLNTAKRAIAKAEGS